MKIFLNEGDRPVAELQNNECLWKLLCYIDLTKPQNDLTLLQ